MVFIIINFKGYGLLALIIQGTFMLVGLFFGMVNESMFWGVPIMSDIFPVLCIEASLVVSLPFLYALQKWLDKKGRTEDSIFNKRPFKWGVLCCIWLAIITVVAMVILLVTGMK